MIIKFLNVKLNNFLSFEEASIDLCDNGYTLVSGINNSLDDNAKSNGSGKSSIWEAISWVLTGETIRGSKDVVNKYTSNGAKVEIDFSINNIPYKLIRTKDDKDLGTNLKFYVNGQDKSGKGIRDTEKILQEYLPDLTSDLLGSVIILGQGLPQRFSNNTPSGRKEVLEKLSKSDYMIEDIKYKLSARKSELSEEFRKYEDVILSLSSKKSVHEEQIKLMQTKLANLAPKDWDNQIANKEQAIIEIENDIINITDKINSDKNELDALKSELAQIDVKIKDIQIDYSNKLNTLLEPYLDDQSSIKYSIPALEQKIRELQSISDICPTCKQKLPNVHLTDTSDMEKDLAERKDKLANLNIVIADLKKANQDQLSLAINNLESKRQSIDVKLVELKLNEDESLVKTMQTSKSTLERDIQSLISERDSFATNKLSLEQNLVDAEKLCSQIADDILYNNIEKDNTKKHLDVISKMLTVATRDFRGFLLISIIDFIQTKAKEYSKDIFDTDKIAFKLDGNNIYIGYNDKQYENLSGGEKQKVDLIIQFAIRDMLSNYLDFSSNILVLDEIFDNLDDVGCQRVLNMISSKLTDIENIFIITHHSDISIPYDNELIIEKGLDNISRVV